MTHAAAILGPCPTRSAFGPFVRPSLPRLFELLTGDRSETGEFQWFGFRVGRARDLERRWPEDGLIHPEKASFLAVVLEDDSCIGWVTWRSVGADPVGTFEIDIALFHENRGQGLGTEAQRQLVDYLFGVTPVHRLQAGTEVDNVAEQHALERVGFLREGIARGLYFRAGKWRDSVLYGLLRTDD